MGTKNGNTVGRCAGNIIKKKIMGNVTIFVIFLIFIIVYVVLGNLKVKSNGEIHKEQIPVPEFDFEEKDEEESAENVGSPAYKKRMMDNFEKRFSQKRSEVPKKEFSKEREPIMKEQTYNLKPKFQTHKTSNFYMENFSLKKAIIYSEILKRKF